jgi:hypothetical protein
MAVKRRIIQTETPPKKSPPAKAYVSYEEEPSPAIAWRSAAKLLTRDEARPIAANIAKLPELLHGSASFETRLANLNFDQDQGRRGAADRGEYRQAAGAIATQRRPTELCARWDSRC